MVRNSRELEDNHEKAVKRTGLRNTIYLAAHYTDIEAQSPANFSGRRWRRSRTPTPRD
jgi:hypothetical protein